MRANRFLFLIGVLAALTLIKLPAAEPTARPRSIGLFPRWMANTLRSRFQKAAAKTARFTFTKPRPAKHYRIPSRTCNIPQRAAARLGTRTAAEFIIRAFPGRVSDPKLI